MYDKISNQFRYIILLILIIQYIYPYVVLDFTPNSFDIKQFMD